MVYNGKNNSYPNERIYVLWKKSIILPAAALSQTLGAFGTGVLFCAIYLRGGSIWVMALMHSLVNAAGTIDALFVNAEDLSSVINGMDGFTQLFYLLPNFLMAAYLLRKSKRQNILDRMQKLRDEILV